MGWFSRSSSQPPKPPRWGFSANWDDFVVILGDIAHEYELELDATQLATGRVDLPTDAVYEYWDLRPLAATCRDVEQHLWPAHIRESLATAFGRPGTRARVDVVEDVPQDAREAKADLRPRLRARSTRTRSSRWSIARRSPACRSAMRGS